MNDSIPLHITTFFLALLSLVWTRVAWRELNFTPESVTISPLHFLLGSVLALGVIFVLTFLMGLSFAGMAVVIGYSVALSLVHPAPAVCILTSYLITRPWEMFPDQAVLEVLPRLFAGLAVFSWLVHLFRRNQLRLVWNHACTILFLFILWLLLTAVVSGHLDNASKLMSGFIPIFTLFFLIVNVPDRLRVIDGLITSIVLSVGAVMAVALYATERAAGTPMGNRLFGLGLMGNSNDLAACIVFVLPLLFFPMMRRGMLSVLRPYFLVMSSLLLVALWYTQSRGALLALGCTILLYVFFDMRTVKGFLLGGTALVTLPVFILIGISRDEADLTVSSESRWGYLIAGLRMFRQHPIFGVGVYNYPHYYDQYAVVFYEWGQQTAHSSWILPLAEAGFLGMLFFVGFYAYAVWRSWKIRKNRPEFFYALIAYGVTISFLSHTYLLFPYLLAALALCATRILEQEAEESATSKEVLVDA